MRLEKGHGTFSGNSTGHFGKLEGLRMLKKLVSLIPLRGARGPLRSTLLYLEITYFTLHTGCITKKLCKIYKENKSFKFLPTIGLSVNNIFQYISFSSKEKEAYQSISLSTSNYISILYFF